MIEPRPYRDERDLEKILALLADGRQANNGTYYVHTGDLKWWLFYTANPRWDQLFLWEDDCGDLLGWVLYSPDWRAFDAFVRPDLRGTPQAEAIDAWAVEGITQIVRRAGGRQAIRTVWISEKDAVVTGWLRRAGFVPDDEYQFMHLMARSLAAPIPAPSLPEGYQLRQVAGESDVENRAAAQHAAFESDMPMEAYCQRYLRFMRSPVYEPERDIVIAAPDGRIAAFCILWLDPLNRVGLFEPVGVHPAYQRRGLGKAVVQEGLRRMQARGMCSAIVCSLWDNAASYRLYEAAGFRAVDILRTFVKAI
jgi:ribosomal protein S18 acetylase RimI-like enzyme